MNPGGSVKDRAARSIIRAAEERGQLSPGGTIVEATAGNTGIGLAHVANELGYKFAEHCRELDSAASYESTSLFQSIPHSSSVCLPRKGGRAAHAWRRSSGVPRRSLVRSESFSERCSTKSGIYEYVAAP